MTAAADSIQDTRWHWAVDSAQAAVKARQAAAAAAAAAAAVEGVGETVLPSMM